MSLQAVIFDLDGVITDTAEYHYLAWQKLADEEGLAFDRTVNEKLRGVSRRESLLIILNGRSLPEEIMTEMMLRKNVYYQQMLHQIDAGRSAARRRKAAGRTGRRRHSVWHCFRQPQRALCGAAPGHCPPAGVLADGRSVDEPKPAPDLFRFAAAKLNAPPGCCLVVEDAAAGVQAALAAGHDDPGFRTGRPFCRLAALRRCTAATAWKMCPWPICKR
jgi:beta-phosphoglucomutase-like phosphatase (HAD superfamily)